MRWLAAACLSVTALAVVLTGTFLPIRVDGRVDYMFAWGGAATAGTAAGIAVLALLAAYWGVRAASGASDGRWLAPIASLGVLTLGILPAVPGVGVRGAPLGYFFYDLRWWWIALAAAVTLWRIYRMLHARLLTGAVGRARVWVTTLPSHRRRRIMDVALFALVTIVSYQTSPGMRSTHLLSGDEPKYLRYDETWYQGHGVDFLPNVKLADANAPMNLPGNLPLLGRAIGQVAKSMAVDVPQAITHPFTFHWLRISGADGFFNGKNGAGMYQIFQPGLSVLMFPGYVWDRSRPDVVAGHNGEFPRDLSGVYLNLLVLYGLAAVVFFRFLAAVLGRDGDAWLAAALAMLSMPIGAFPFQLYPEVAAFLLTFVAAVRIWPTDRARVASAWAGVVAGLAAGALGWLHPRFLIVSLVLTAVALWRTGNRARLAYLGGWAVILLTLGGYMYYITGSWSPAALYSASTDLRPTVWSGVPENVVAYFLHSRLGAAAHAPWLLIALPGLALLWRIQREAAIFVLALAGGLIVVAAGHAVDPAGGTPGRMIAAVVPLFVWPLAVLWRRAWPVSAAFRALATVSVLLSIETAVAYNLHHTKFAGRLIDEHFSGWRLNLAFPEARAYFSGPSEPGFYLTVIVVAILAVACFVAWRFASGKKTFPAIQSAAGAMAVVALLIFSTAASSSQGHWTRGEYFASPRFTLEGAARSLVTLDRCRICFSSAAKQIDWTSLPENPATMPALRVEAGGRRATVHVDLGAKEELKGFGRVEVDFGDGTERVVVGVFGETDVAHEYAGAGTYQISVSLLTPTPQVARHVITLGG